MTYTKTLERTTASQLDTAFDLSFKRIDNPLVDIVVPCRNEAKTLHQNITKLHEYISSHADWAFRITIADSASTDETVEVADALSNELPDIRIVHEPVKGRGRALKSAWMSSDADVLIYLDEDLSTDLRHINDLIEPLVEGNAALSIGSRLHENSSVDRGLKREIISRGYISLVKRFLKLPITDAQCGFKAIRADIAKHILPKVKDNNWFFDTELIARIHQEEWPIHELGVRWNENTDSRVALVKTTAEDIAGIDRLRKESGAFWTIEKLGFGSLLLFSTILYSWNLTINGLANSYYSAAVQAATNSWSAFFFGSLDSASWVTIDKPPVSIWIPALFTRMLGFNSFSMLLSHALAGVATIALVYLCVRRYGSVRAALLTGTVMALTPAAALMFRFNNPDSFLTLFLAASLYTFMRAIESGRLTWLIATGALIGTAFNTKMIQALIIIPIYLAVYLYAAKGNMVKRAVGTVVAAISTAIFTLWWPLIVSLIPSSERPYIGSTSDDNIWSLIFGYNGLSRFLGGQGQAGGGMGGGPNGGVGFGGETGLFRMFNQDFGPNIAWLLPLGLICALATLWWLRGQKRTHMQRALVLVSLGWVLIHAAVFSMTGGTIHPYYVVVLAPALAVLIGIGVPYLYAGYERLLQIKWLLPIAIFLSGATSLILLGYDTSWLAGLAWPIFIVTSVSSLVMTIHIIMPINRLVSRVVPLAVIAIATGPITYSLATISVAHTGSIPTAGLTATAMAGSNNENASISDELREFLLAGQNGATWVAATSSANESASIQISTNQPVMALGGFNGGDNTTTLFEFKQLIIDGKLRYFISGGMGRGGMGGNSEITSWITSNAQTIDYGGNDNVTVYDLTSTL